VWNTINLRNDRQHFQDGLFMLDIPTFNEAATREAILNAVTHREYRLGGSIFVRQYTRRLEIVSPGGLPPGITPENILWKQFPRNRRIADAVARCGLVERAGQGMDRIFEACIRESKPKPDFTHTDAYEVWVTLRGEVQDPRFLRFLEQINREGLGSFTIQDLVVLDCVHHDQPVPEELRARLAVLAERGIIERVRRGEYILSRRFYSFLGQSGVYTRKRGLDKATNKELLMKHIRDAGKEGASLSELLQVNPALSRSQVQKLVLELKAEGRVYVRGRANAARWYAGPPPDGGGHAALDNPGQT
jgi:ATP-dependent DNA helicase RecG